MPKRGGSAYFAFCKDQREKAHAECVAELGTEKVSVAVVAKRLGEIWRQLSDEEKLRYKELAKAQADSDDEREAAEEKGAEGSPEADEAVKSSFVLPANAVKRVMKLNSNVSSISADATAAVAKSAELALQGLVEEAFRVASSKKRSKLVYADVEAAVSRDPRWVDSGLLDLLRAHPGLAAARAGHAGASRAKQIVEDPSARKITTFFPT